MNEAHNGQSEQHHILLDISLFTVDLLNPNKIAARESTTPFSFEVPGAFVTMIQYARVGSPLLRDFLYAYLLRIRQDKERSESYGGRIPVLANVREKERLKKEATLAAERIVKGYAPLIEGALEPPPEYPPEEFPPLEERPGDEASWSRSNQQRGPSEPGYPIQRYEAIDLPTPEGLDKLRKAYARELNLPTHPLLDLYFLQVYHGQRIGLAAASIPRRLISLGISTYQILSSVIPLPPPGPRGREFWRQVQDVGVCLEEFLAYVKKEAPTTALVGVLELAIFFFPIGGPLVPVLISIVGGLTIGVVQRAPWGTPLEQFIVSIIMTFILISVVAIGSILVVGVWPRPPSTPVCPPTPDLPAIQVVSAPTPPTPSPTIVSVEPSPTPSVSAPTPETARCVYVVQPGDTLQDIAARFQVSEDNLRTANNLSDSGSVGLHQKLIISAPCCQPIGGQGISYIVQRKETLYSLARRYGTTVENIARANHIYDINYIQTGQMLCVPSTEIQ